MASNPVSSGSVVRERMRDGNFAKGEEIHGKSNVQSSAKCGKLLRTLSE